MSTLQTQPKREASSGANTMPPCMRELPDVIVVCGHYGVGKTNLCLNLAVDFAQAGRQTSLIDLDVVNPYFRSSDYPDVLSAAGVELIKPPFAGTALDAPMLSGRVITQIEQAHVHANTVIVDVGGDDAGATALGSFSDAVVAGDYAMLYVINAMREQTRQPDQALQLLYEVQNASHCAATHLVNNTHLQRETELSTINKGLEFAETVAKEAALPILCTTLPVRLQDCVDLPTLACDSLYMVQEYVVTPWDA